MLREGRLSRKRKNKGKPKSALEFYGKDTSQVLLCFLPLDLCVYSICIAPWIERKLGWGTFHNNKTFGTGKGPSELICKGVLFDSDAF